MNAFCLKFSPLALVSSLSLLTLSACSSDPLPEHAVLVPATDLPDTVVGYARWRDGERKPIHRVHCGQESPHYVMLAEGKDFTLRVGFWGEAAATPADIDFEQADSVELRAVDDELQYYRYSTLRILPEMGKVSGSERAAQGQTPLRPTSLAAIEAHQEGVELDFDLSCSGGSLEDA